MNKMTTFVVRGVVSSTVRAGVGNLRVEIVDKNVGGGVHVAEAITDDKGNYQVSFTIVDLEKRHKTQPDLQARVVAGEDVVGASDVYYNASQHETLNVLLEDDKAKSVLRSEYEVLTSALAGQFKGRLGDLRETDGRQDITYLANKTGWDTQAGVMAASQFSDDAKEAKMPSRRVVVTSLILSSSNR